MLNAKLVQMIVDSAKAACEPEKDLERYVETLITTALDALEINSEDLKLDEGIVVAVDAALNISKDAFVILDVDSLYYLAHGISSSPKEASFCLTPTLGSLRSDEDIEKANDLLHILSSGFDGITEKFLGAVQTLEDIKPYIHERSVFQLRSQQMRGSLCRTFEWYSLVDELWSLGKKIMLWRGEGVNEYGALGENLASYDNPLATPYDLAAIMELPSSMDCWLFLFESNGNKTVQMLDLSHEDESSLLSSISWDGIEALAKVKDVSLLEVAINQNFCPHYYCDNEAICVEARPLGSVAKIQRGSSLGAKNLDILGTVHDRKATTEHIICLTAETEYGARGSVAILEGDRHYIDNASIDEDGTIGDPKVIASIPEKEERYTLFPEDGCVVLIPRNGKAVALFRAKVPTLISSNVLIVRPDAALIDPDYFACIMKSDHVEREIRLMNRPLTKEDLSKIELPFVDEVTREAVIARNKRIEEEMEAAYSQIRWLRDKDSFDPIDALGLAAIRSQQREKLMCDRGSHE